MLNMAGTRAKFPSRQGSAKVREPRNPMGPMSANKKRGGEPLVGHLWDGFCHILSNLVRVESEKNLAKNQLTYFSRWFHVPKPIKIGSCNTFETLILGWVGLRGVHSGKGTYYYTNPYFIYEGGRFAGGQTGSNGVKRGQT